MEETRVLVTSNERYCCLELYRLSSHNTWFFLMSSDVKSILGTRCKLWKLVNTYTDTECLCAEDLWTTAFDGVGLRHFTALLADS